MSALPNIKIEEFHAGKDTLIIFYTHVLQPEVQELELSKEDAVRLMLRSGWLDDADIYKDIVMVRFETVSDDINHNGNHVQRIQRMHMEWDEFRLWVTEREVRDVVKLFLKDKQPLNVNN